MVAVRNSAVSVEEYLRRELRAEHRNEYWNGTIVAMSGASQSHNRIFVNLVRHLGNQLHGGQCSLFGSETRVYAAACTSYFYPDVQIVCGKVQRAPTEAETLLNPTVIIEVLSESTAAVDRGRKFACYRTLESLQHYILIDQYDYAIDVHVRRPDGTWNESFLRGLDARLQLESYGISLPFADVYDGVEIDRDPAASITEG